MVYLTITTVNNLSLVVQINDIECVRNKHCFCLKGDGNPDDYYVLYERS